MQTLLSSTGLLLLSMIISVIVILRLGELFASGQLAKILGRNRLWIEKVFGCGNEKRRYSSEMWKEVEQISKFNATRSVHVIVALIRLLSLSTLSPFQCYLETVSRIILSHSAGDTFLVIGQFIKTTTTNLHSRC